MAAALVRNLAASMLRPIDRLTCRPAFLLYDTEREANPPKKCQKTV